MKSEEADRPKKPVQMGEWANIIISEQYPTPSSTHLQKTYRINLLIGQFSGLGLCIVGVIFTILGLSGSIEWLVEAQGIQSKLTNASPGVFFGLMGFILLWRYRARAISYNSEGSGSRDRLSKNQD